MKNANIDVHGVYSLFNTGVIEVHIEDGTRQKYTTRQKGGNISSMAKSGFILMRL